MPLKHWSLAPSYAQAMLDLALEANQAEDVRRELKSLADVYHDNPVFAVFVADPAIDNQERGRVVQRIFKGRVSGLVWNFLGVLHDKGRLAHLPDIAVVYDRLLDARLGIVELDVTVARPLAEAELEQIRLRVSQALNIHAVAHQTVDDTIIGGMVLRMQDRLFDGSLRTQLRALRTKMLWARPA